MINLQDIINDPDFIDTFTVYRKSGEFVLGGYDQTETTISMMGTIITADAETLAQVPEGDRVVNAKSFYSILPIYRTNTEGTSDEIEWRSERYRVLQVFDRSFNGGYYKAVCARMAGN